MSLSSLLATQESGLWKWLKANTKQSKYPDIMRALYDEAGKVKAPATEGTNFLLTGLAMGHAVGLKIEDPYNWLKTSALFRTDAREWAEKAKTMPAADWALDMANAEHVRRGAKPYLIGEATRMDMHNLCSDLSWIKPPEDAEVVRHLTFYYSGVLGGADIQWAFPKAGVMVRTKTGTMVLDDMMRAALYPALDPDPHRWRYFTYAMTRQRKLFAIDIQWLWEELHFDVDAFQDFLDECMRAEPEDDDLVMTIMLMQDEQGIDVSGDDDEQAPTLPEGTFVAIGKHVDSNARKHLRQAMTRAGRNRR